MTKQEFRNLIEQGPIILDGAMGTGLMKAGMSVDECTEKWAIEHPDVVMSIQKAYIEAGAQIIYAPTFGANRIKLKEYGLYIAVDKLQHQEPIYLFRIYIAKKYY